MAVSERSVTGKIEVLEDGQVQLREDTVIERDGAEISRLYHRKVLEPGQDINTEPERVKSICNIIWTPEVIEEYKRKKAERQAAIEKAIRDGRIL